MSMPCRAVPCHAIPDNSDECQGHHWKGYTGWVLLAPALFAAFLGGWQVNRYAWKVDLLEQRAKALQVGQAWHFPWGMHVAISAQKPQQ